MISRPGSRCGRQLTPVPVLGAADRVQVLLLGCHGGSLQRLCVALQGAQLLPLAVHVVLVPLQVRRLEAQEDSEHTVPLPTMVAPANVKQVIQLTFSDIKYCPI